MTKEIFKIHLHSRYSNVTTILEQTNDPNVFNVNTNSSYIRQIFDSEKDVEDRKIAHIDFEGGPFVSIGNKDIYKGHVLKDMYYDMKDCCYKFVFEDNEDKE